MRLIAIIGLSCAIYITAGMAAAKNPEPLEQEFQKYEKYQVVDTRIVEPSKTRSETSAKIRPLALPNIKKITRELLAAERSVATKQLRKSRTVLAFWEGQGRWVRAPRKEKCWEVPWQRSCTIARASYKLHLSLSIAAKRKLWWELPLTNDWQTAVRIAQRVYPGTSGELLRLSDREGGWGRWVWYSGACTAPPCLWRGYHVGGDNVSGADTVGGWMQFRWSTFAPYWRQTVADLTRRGFMIPEIPMPPAGGPVIYAPWLSPLGQALTAAYMHHEGKAGCHWCL